MLKSKYLFYISIPLLLCTLISISYWDRPIALFMHRSSLDQIKQLRYITEYLPYIIGVLFITVIVRSKRYILWLQKIVIIIYFYLALYITMEIKTVLKMIFGRYWPKTWLHNNLSLISNNVYGFNFFHGADNMGSFPSGHSTYVTFCVIWLIKICPEARFFFILIGALVPISLIILDYHFVSDCVGGIILGMNFAVFSICIYNFWQR